MADGLQKFAGNRLQKLLGILTTNRVLGVLVGAGVTAIIQSSSATTVMVVGFVNAGIINLLQATGIIMGANIGTTVTSWIVSMSEWGEVLKPEFFAPVLFGAGAFITLFAKSHKKKEGAEILIGFALLFIGLSFMSGAIKPYRDAPIFSEAFRVLGQNPILGILTGLVVTAVIQSSSASVGILQTLAINGMVNWQSAIFITLGQNIGTCVTALLSSIGAKKNAKTAAIMHLLFNIIGTIIFSIAAIVFFKLINPEMGMGMITQTQISSVHTIFNIGTTVLLFPVSDQIIRLAKRLQKDEEVSEDESKVLMDERMLQTPAIALQSVEREVCRMGNIVKATMDRAKQVLFTKDYDMILEIKEEENTVDRLCSGITDYLIRISTLAINEKEHQRVASLLQIVSDIERVGDYCENISEYAEDLKARKASFSEVGAREMREMLEICSGSFTCAVEALEEKDREKALAVIDKESRADDMEVRMRTAHMKRLADKECSQEAGIVFVDTLAGLERISDHARNIAEEVLGHML